MEEHFAEEYFCLKWSEHPSNLCSHFASFLKSEALCDVTIACEGGLSLKAHKLVLSASSPFFHQLFLDHPATHPIIILSDLKYTHLKTLLDFMYSGHVNVSEDQLAAILKAAQNLKIQGLDTEQLKSKEIHSDHSYVEPSNELHINPSKLMEQSMTTEDGYAKKLFLENSPEHESIHYAKNIDYDSLHIQLPQGSESPQLEDSQTYQPSEGVGELQLEGFSDSSKRGRKPGSRLCVVCKHIFHSENELEKHMDDHKGSLPCEDATISPVLDLNETKPVTEKNLLKLPLLCSTCAYVMNTLSDAQSHLNSSPSCRTSQFKCQLCPKLFIWPATLMKHFREQHEGPDGITRVARRMWYFCDVCKKPLLSKHALSLHRSKFHGLNQPSGSEESLDYCKRGRKRGTRVCGICKRTFLGSEYFTHVQTVHKNISLSDSSVDTTFITESMDNESNSTQSAT